MDMVYWIMVAGIFPYVKVWAMATKQNVPRVGQVLQVLITSSIQAILDAYWARADHIHRIGYTVELN